MTPSNRELVRLALGFLRDERRWLAQAEKEEEAGGPRFVRSPKLARLILLHQESADRLAAAMRHRRTWWVRAGDHVVLLSPDDFRRLHYVPAEPGPLDPKSCPNRYPYLSEPAP